MDNICLFLDESDMVHAKLNYIYSGKLIDDCLAIPIERIIGLGIFISVTKDKSCVTLRPNSVESG